MIQCTFLLRVSLLSCHSPPSGQLSTVSVWHGFITEDILQQSWLEVFPPNTPLLSTYSHPSSAKPVHPFPVTSSNSWRNRSDLKSFHCKVFFQGYVVGYAFYNAIEKQDYFLLIPFLSSDYHLCSTTPPPPPKSGPNTACKKLPLFVGLFLTQNSTLSLLTVKPKKYLYQRSARSNTGAGQCYFWQRYDLKCTSAHNFKPNQFPDPVHATLAVQYRELHWKNEEGSIPQ